LAALIVTVLVAAVVIVRAVAGHGSAGGQPQPSSAGSASAGHRGSSQGGTGTKDGARDTNAKGSPLSPDWKGDGRPVTLAFGGDVHFESSLATRLAADPATALDGISALLSGADLSMTNFESALISGACTDPQPKQFVFHAPPAAITAFKDAHVTLVSEANNHGEDCGRPGLAQSLSIAKAAGFPVLGIGANAAQAFAPFRTSIHGQRIAIIAATEVIDSDLLTSWTATATQAGLASAYQEGELVAAVQAARQDSDTVVVFLHWGTETQQCPNSVQPPLAKALVKAGADIVIGSHAHVQLGAGYLGSALVDYGLGNLAFYDTTPPETYSGALHVTITGRYIDSFNWRPAEISNGLPVALTGASAAAVAVQRWTALRGCTGPGRDGDGEHGEHGERDAPVRRPVDLAAGPFRTTAEPLGGAHHADPLTC
jgi:poly-gamma-glutamate synthesis protein (capsule biosynthesis protein)